MPVKVHATAAPGSCDRPHPGMADSLLTAAEHWSIPYVGWSWSLIRHLESNGRCWGPSLLVDSKQDVHLQPKLEQCCLK